MKPFPCIYANPEAISHRIFKRKGISVADYKLYYIILYIYIYIYINISHRIVKRKGISVVDYKLYYTLYIYIFKYCYVTKIFFIV